MNDTLSAKIFLIHFEAHCQKVENSNIFISRHPEVIFFLIIFLTCLRTQVTKRKIIEDETSLETFLGWPEKWVFRRFYENWSNSIMVSSLTRGQIIKRKLILDSPILRLLEKMKILIFNILRTSYGDLKECSKMDKFYPFGITTQKCHKNVKFIRK